MMDLPIACDSCIHLTYTAPDGTFKCEAFPDGVPDVITDGSNPHTAPVAGDGGVHYELKPGKYPAILHQQYLDRRASNYA